MQPLDRCGWRFGRSLLAEINVIDRELIVAIDEIDQALAHTVNRRDVEFHRTRAHGNLPCAKVERAPERIVGIAHANGKSADDGALDRLHGTRDVGGLRVDDEVHRPLPVELHFARAMPSHELKSHLFEKAAERLRARRREFDELDAVESDRVGGLANRFTFHGACH